MRARYLQLHKRILRTLLQHSRYFVIYLKDEQLLISISAAAVPPVTVVLGNNNTAPVVVVAPAKPAPSTSGSTTGGSGNSGSDSEENAEVSFNIYFNFIQEVDINGAIVANVSLSDKTFNTTTLKQNLTDGSVVDTYDFSMTLDNGADISISTYSRTCL